MMTTPMAIIDAVLAIALIVGVFIWAMRTEPDTEE